MNPQCTTTLEKSYSQEANVLESTVLERFAFTGF